MNLQNAKNPIMPTHGAADAAVANASDQFITFTLGAEEYGVDIMAVQEIKGWTATTAIPNAPGFMRGVINLRGIIVPIVDLRARFGMAPIEPTNMHVVIIITTAGRTTGLLVDAVSDIISVAPEAIRPVPEIGASGERMLSGLVALDDRMVSLVTLDGLIASAQATPCDGAAVVPN
jgi:purine-binding chemotaxis protein CheW